MRRLLAVFGAVVLALLALAVVRTLRIPAPAEVRAEAGAPIAIDSAAAAAHLAGAIKFPTVSYSSGGKIDTAAFLGLHQYLDSTFPLVRQTLRRETVAGLSLLYTWPGTDTTLAPVVLMGHMDVVPVPEPNLPQWIHDPFSGEVAEGFVWGRGTLDDKTTVLSILDAVELLLKDGYRPPRTVYLTFGHDEEVGGRYGARAIVDRLVKAGVKPALVLDEGGFVSRGMMPGLPGRVAIVGIAEKGYLSLRLKAKAAGGHSSMPTGRTAVGALAKAIAKLEANQFPSQLEGPTRTMVEAMAPYLPFTRRLAVANLWMTKHMVTTQLARDPLGAALLHTTTAPTMLMAGVKDNVLPPEATAIVNFRIRPGETAATVTERVRQVIGDSLVEVGPQDSAWADPSPVSSVTSPAYQLVASAIRGMLPGESVPVIPYLVMGGTDAKFWGPNTDKALRFLPIPMGEGDRERIHGVNERVSIGDYATAVRFFVRVLRGIDRL